MVALRTCVFLGLALQTLLYVLPEYAGLPMLLRCGISLLGLFSLGAAVAIAEGVLVKLKWRKVPGFLAFATVLRLLAALIAAAQA